MLAVQGFNYPDEGQQEGPGGPRPRVAALTTPPQLLARAGAAVAPGQAATMRWKEEETALFCPMPRNSSSSYFLVALHSLSRMHQAVCV